MLQLGDIMNFGNVTPRDSKVLLTIVPLFLSFFSICVFLDITILRQIIGFIYLTFIPGFVFLTLLKPNSLNTNELILLSIGSSVAFLMLAGVLINELFPLLGIFQPLSVVNLMIILNIPILVACVLIHISYKEVTLWKPSCFSMSPISLIFLLLPIISVIGTSFINIYNDNVILLVLIILIPLLVVLGVFSKRVLPENLYPLALLLIGLSILFHASLISNLIVPYGSDIPGEYYLFKLTQSDSYWSSVITSSSSTMLQTYNNMLSITVLPTIYVNLLNIEPAIMFKLIYPLLFSVVPVVLYSVWKEYIDKKYAFIATFLFMAQNTFYFEMISLTRQMVAELFFVLLLFVILHKKIKPVIKIMCFLLFSFGMVTSHYSIATIFLFFLLSSSILLYALKRPSKKITFNLVVLFFVIMFTWYLYTSGGASFTTLLDKAEFVTHKFGDFFNPASRGSTILTGLGLTESPSIWNTISRFVAYGVQGLIVVGFLAVVTKLKTVQKEYFALSVIATTFLGMLIVVPGLAGTLNMTRFFHILLIFLAPLCVIGASLLVKLLLKRENKIVVCTLLLVLLVPYFLFQTNFVYEVTESDSWSIPLSGYRMDAARLYGDYGYIDEYGVFSAQWLSENVNLRASTVYADERTSANTLIIYALFKGALGITNTTKVEDGDFVYLSTLNVVHDVFPHEQSSWNSSELSIEFNGLNLIYSNGNSNIYQNP